tara:strand:+ start:5899 stop:6690 length:792 start_codon:yes stop_codon:yes gene_type:complete
MPFLVIDKVSANTIFTDDDPEINLIEFQTKEDAEEYLKGKKSISKEIIRVFTDGSCRNNGKPNAKAGIGIYFGKDNPKNVSKRIQGKQSNNTAELSAVIEVFTILKDEIKQNQNIIIYTDSKYVIQCCTSYGEKCEIINWKKSNGEIPNVELVKEVYSLYQASPNVTLEWIQAHTNQTDELSIGNEGADKLANMSIEEEDCHYSPINKILNDKRIYLLVPFANKEVAKKNGAKWDKEKKKWYYTENLPHEKKNTLLQTFNLFK